MTYVFLTLAFFGLISFIRVRLFTSFQKMMLAPLLVTPVLIALVFYQWTTHPFGLIFFFPLIACAGAAGLYMLVRRYRGLGVFIVSFILLVGGWMSQGKIDFFYNEFLILGPRDIVIVKSIRPEVVDRDVCLGRNEWGLSFGGIVEWYLRNQITHAPDCVNSDSSIALAFQPGFGEFFTQETQFFIDNRFTMIGCADFLCILERL